MKPLSTAPASAHKLHRPQAFCMKDRPNDNYLEVTFFGEATGPDKMIVAAQRGLSAKRGKAPRSTHITFGLELSHQAKKISPFGYFRRKHRGFRFAGVHGGFAA